MADKSEFLCYCMFGGNHSPSIQCENLPWGAPLIASGQSCYKIKGPDYLIKAHQLDYLCRFILVKEEEKCFSTQQAIW